MAESAAQRALRLIDLVPYLLNNPGISVKDVAHTFEVSVQDLVKDLDLLFMCGLPGYTPLELIDLTVEDGVISLRDPQNLNNPRRFTQSEALLIRVGLAALEDILPQTKRARVRELRDKFAKLFTNDIPTGAIYFSADSERTKLKSLTEAVMNEKKVLIEYFNPVKSEIKQRLLSIIKIVPESNRTLIEAWCHTSNGMRTFNLTNIQSISISSEPAEVMRLADENKGSEQATISLSKESTFFADNQDQLSQEGEHFLINVFQSEWLIRNALAQQGDLTILTPQWMRQEVASRSKEALRQYSRFE